MKKDKEEDEEYKWGKDKEVEEKEEEQEMVPEIIGEDEAGKHFCLLLHFCFQCYHILTFIVAQMASPYH